MAKKKAGATGTTSGGKSAAKAAKKAKAAAKVEKKEVKKVKASKGKGKGKAEDEDDQDLEGILERVREFLRDFEILNLVTRISVDAQGMGNRAYCDRGNCRWTS